MTYPKRSTPPRKIASYLKKYGLRKKISDIKQRGASWLEPAREFVLSLNQAAKLLESGDTKSMTTFLKNISSNHILRNREFSFAPKLQYALAAEPLAAASGDLQFFTVCPGRESNSHGLAANGF